MKYSVSYICLLAFILITACQSTATEVTVYSESGYSANTFIVKIFADIDDDTDGPLISAGIKMTYPDEKLTNPVPVKNESTWYFGSQTNGYSYIDPFSETTGEIIILLGKLDASSPFSGVSEARILLSCVSFDRIENTEVPVPSDFTLDYGRVTPYTNFTTVTGVSLDQAVVFNPSIQVKPLSLVYLTNSIRALKTITLSPQSLPARFSELDIDNNNIGLTDALYYLNKAIE